jgi:hypothetical protein
MDNRSWMYKDSPQGLQGMDYCNRVQGFVNYILSNPRNISEGGIKCSCKMCKNKKFLDPDCVTMHLLQKVFVEKYSCWYTHGEPYVPHNIQYQTCTRIIFYDMNYNIL